MSKANRQRKIDAKAYTDARKLTVGKVVRLVLKSFLFAVIFALLISYLPSLGVPESLTQTFWFPVVLASIIYIPAYPFLMSEFRVPRPKR